MQVSSASTLLPTTVTPVSSAQNEPASNAAALLAQQRREIANQLIEQELSAKQKKNTPATPTEEKASV